MNALKRPLTSPITVITGQEIVPDGVEAAVQFALRKLNEANKRAEKICEDDEDCEVPAE